MHRFAEQLSRFLTWVDAEARNIAEYWREHANRRSIAIIIVGGLAALIAYVTAIAPPVHFPTGQLVTVPGGVSAAEASAVT